MNQATLLTAVGCSGSLAAALLFGQPALAALETSQDSQATSAEAGQVAIAHIQSNNLETATLGYTADESLRDALGCACALCNVNRERSTTPPIQ